MLVEKFANRILIAVGLVIGNGAPASADIDICANGIVHTTDAGRQVTFVDTAPEGTSIGDKRVGQKDILNADGDKIGVFRWVATVVHMAEGNGKPVYAVQKFYEFDDGILFGTSLDNVNAQVGDTANVSITSGQTSIHGGVGRYAGATGTKQHKRHPDTGRFTYTFNIECK